MKNFLLGISGLLFILACVAGCIFLAALLIAGGAWVGSVVLPFVNLLSWITIYLTVLVLLPLSFFKKTRSSSAVLLLFASYVFGLAAWFKGFLWAYNIWGVVGVLVGVFLFGDVS